jgi:hypothetical protein
MTNQIKGQLPRGVRPLRAAEYEGLLIIATTDGIFVADTEGDNEPMRADPVGITTDDGVAIQ